MKIGILGTGDVGRALGKGFIAIGHEVKIGSRAAGNEKAVAWAEQAGASASEGSFADAARFGEVLVIATVGAAAEEAIRMAGVESFAGKVVIDTTNPLDFSHGFPPRLFVGTTDSLGERIQRVIPAAKVVKAWNTIGNAHMFRPEFPGGPPDMFIAGDDEGAKEQVSAILRDFGLNPVDLGGISSSRWLEAMCMAWVLYGATSGTWGHAFKLLKK